ncbi:heat shock protein 67B1-like [Musca vetustissima]|uniref:heat shock protein 67B1-like n=1 Tax=Musca vetustissima TaxID=27455 RepID=UPI002AB6EEF2|nr:heat shock protein 67B1-like [Musca vetustissima]
MSLIPFILDLADELHEFSRCLANGIDINDFGFGLYTGSEQQTHSQPPSASTSPQQQQQQSPRRSRTSSFSSFWLPSKRHHPYNRIKSACCGKNAGEEGGATNSNVATASPEKDATIVPTPNKTASYSVVNKNGFQVSMNVKQFAPNELSVKTIDNCIVVEGRHDDKEDGHGVISRHFVRKYMLPKGYDPKDVMSTLSSDGILTVKAPPPPPPSAKVDEPNERIVAIQPTPGPTQMVPTPMSAAAAQPKEQTKKLLSPAAREECQLPEKRQKLDVAQQQQQEEDEKQATLKQQQAPTQTIPATITTTTQSTSTPPQSPTPEQPDAGAGALNDNENDGEQTAEIDDKQQQQQQKGGEDVDEGGQQQQQQQPPTAAEDITDIETNNAVAAITAEEDKTENQLETKESEKQKTEEEQKDVVEEKLPETNGSDNIIGEIAEATEPAAESCNTTTTTNSSAEKINDEVPAEAVSEADGKSTAMEVDGDDDVADQTKTTADEDATVTGASEDKLKEVVTDEEKNVDGKCPETAENSNSTPTNSDKEEQDNKTNSKSTGENPADASESPVAAESANDKVTDTETAVDTTTTTTANTTIATDIDVALLKKAAATADAAEITAAAENALLSEPMDGIATTDSAVDTVECSLFAKTLGNGNSNSAATALVAKEEVAN